MQIDVQFKGSAYMYEHHHSRVYPLLDKQKEGLTGGKMWSILVILKNNIQVVDVILSKEYDEDVLDSSDPLLSQTILC